LVHVTEMLLASSAPKTKTSLSPPTQVQMGARFCVVAVALVGGAGRIRCPGPGLVVPNQTSSTIWSATAATTARRGT